MREHISKTVRTVDDTDTEMNLYDDLDEADKDLLTVPASLDNPKCLHPSAMHLSLQDYDMPSADDQLSDVSTYSSSGPVTPRTPHSIQILPSVLDQYDEEPYATPILARYSIDTFHPMHVDEEQIWMNRPYDSNFCELDHAFASTLQYRTSDTLFHYNPSNFQPQTRPTSYYLPSLSGAFAPSAYTLLTPARFGIPYTPSTFLLDTTHQQRHPDLVRMAPDSAPETQQVLFDHRGDAYDIPLQELEHSWNLYPSDTHINTASTTSHMHAPHLNQDVTGHNSENPIQLPPPPEITVLLRAYEQQVPVSLVAARGYSLLPVSLPEEYAYAFLGFFFVKDVVVSAVART